MGIHVFHQTHPKVETYVTKLDFFTLLFFSVSLLNSSVYRVVTLFEHLFQLNVNF